MVNPRKRIGSWLRDRFGGRTISFLGHSSNYFIGTLFSKGLGFITVPVFTRLLTPGDYGRFALFHAASSLLFMAFGLNVDNSLQRLYFDEEEEFPALLRSNLVFLLSWGLCLFGVLAALAPRISGFFELTPGLFLLAALASFLSVVLNLWTGNNRVRFLSRRNMWLNVTMQSLNAATAIFLVMRLPEEKYMGRVWSRLAVHGLFAVIGTVMLIRLSSGPFRWRHVKNALRFGLPLIPNSFAGRILVSFDRIVIKRLVDEWSAGLYSFVYNVSYLGNVLTLVLNKTLSPMVMKALKDGRERDVAALSRIYIYILALGDGALILFASEIVTVMAPAEYHAAVGVMQPIIWSYFISGIDRLIGHFYYYEKRTGLTAAISLTAAGMNVGLNFWLIPVFGYAAAAWTTLFCYVFLFVVRTVVVYRLRETVPINWKAVGIATGMMGAFSLGFVLIGRLSDDLLTAILVKTAFYASVSGTLGYSIAKKLRLLSRK